MNCQATNEEYEGLIHELSTIVKNVVNMNENNDERLENYINRNKNKINYILKLNTQNKNKEKFTTIANNFL